jgi:hypothetical protein
MYRNIKYQVTKKKKRFSNLGIFHGRDDQINSL